MAKDAKAARSASSVSLAGVQAQLLTTAKEKNRARRLLKRHHYLGDVRAVGEQLFYAVSDSSGDWLGVLVFCAASRRLRARDGWIGWSEEQRRRRLALVACRVRLAQSMRVMGLFRRFSSLFMHWRSRQNKLKHKTTTDFFAAMNAEHHRYAIRCLNARQPSFQNSS